MCLKCYWIRTGEGESTKVGRSTVFYDLQDSPSVASSPAPSGNSNNPQKKHYPPHKLAYASRSATQAVLQELRTMGYRCIRKPHERLQAALSAGLPISSEERRRLEWESKQINHYQVAIKNASKWCHDVKMWHKEQQKKNHKVPV